MANSRTAGLHGRFPSREYMQARTPGSLGWNDAADPSVASLVGDSPGCLGRNDLADAAAQILMSELVFAVRRIDVALATISQKQIEQVPTVRKLASAKHQLKAVVRKKSAQHIITSDPTGKLPSPNPNAPKLSDADFKSAAEGLGVEAAAIRAVAQVESGGRSGFDNLGRPKILFEAHYFHRFTAGKYDQTYPQLSQPSQKLGKKYYALDQWTRMYQAMELDLESAWKSASWGMFQIMGSNHNGWDSVSEFVEAMFKSEFEQLNAFLAYCKGNNLVKALKNKDWAAFAAGYNGADYASQQYDTKIKNAYDKYNPA